jgi:hypothetical protein
MTIRAEDIVAAARQQTGLRDLGDESILEGLGVLADALSREARLTEQGEHSVRKTLIETLANRMRVEDYLKKHPQLLARSIEKPTFVFGLPRTGTTLAINLLQADPARRAFLRWEAFDSVPPPKLNELHAGPRFDTAQAQVDLSLKYAPHISASPDGICRHGSGCAQLGRQKSAAADDRSGQGSGGAKSRKLTT